MTLSLTDLANGKRKSEEEAVKTDSIDTSPPKNEIDASFTLENLKDAWNEFAEQRKSQVGEYHLLKQEFTFLENQVTIHLSNPLEEPILQAIRAPLTEFLRARLGNSRLNVTSEVKQVHSQKIAYTNKEKFDHLAEKNPILKELKERLGLDPDF
ncbi:MAG: hypothetical protein RIA63_13300 [Cyclobacteriaceae bacterium]